jgi:D-aminopeptidase
MKPSISPCRARDLGITPGVLPTGTYNNITDVPGVTVGHCTVMQDDDIRTGVTAVLPHQGNIFQEKVPAGLVVGNGFGKLMGATQVLELGEIETPLLLTNTLAVPRAADAILDWTLSQPGNENCQSVNPFVGETNDGFLNNIRKRVLTPEHFLSAITNAQTGHVDEGSVGAGTGTVAFGWKGGIGSSSRKLPENLGGFILGVLVQTNFGGILQISGKQVGLSLGQYYLKEALNDQSADGSIMIIIATDAPLSDRNLTRLARRSFAGLARTGASLTDGSGDYCLAFSAAPEVRRTPARRRQVYSYPEVPNSGMSPLFQAAIEATEEAILNSLFMSTSMTGFQGTIQGLPMERVRSLLEQKDH